MIWGLNRSNLQLDRKILSDLARNEPFSFRAVLEEIRLQKSLGDFRADEMSFDEAVFNNYISYEKIPPQE